MNKKMYFTVSVSNIISILGSVIVSIALDDGDDDLT